MSPAPAGNPLARCHFRHGMLPQLAVFEAAARLGSFTRAAHALHLAQPTVSTQMRKLTQALGVTLFEQVGRQVRLTEAGEVLREACQELFACFARLDSSLAELRALDTGVLRIAVASSAVPVVTPLVARFTQRHPAIELRVQVGNRAQIAGWLASGDHDLYVLADDADRRTDDGLPQEGPSHRPDDASVEALPLGTQRLAVVARADHPLAAQRRIPAKRLATEVFVLRELESGARAAADAAFARTGIKPRIRMTMSCDAAIREAVAAGLGLALLPDKAAATDSPSPLAVLDVAGLEVVRRWRLARPAGRHTTPAARAFLAIASQAPTRVDAGDSPVGVRPPAIDARDTHSSATERADTTTRASGTTPQTQSQTHSQAGTAGDPVVGRLYSPGPGRLAAAQLRRSEQPAHALLEAWPCSATTRSTRTRPRSARTATPSSSA